MLYYIYNIYVKNEFEIEIGILNSDLKNPIIEFEPNLHNLKSENPILVPNY